MVYYLRVNNDAFDWITDYVRSHRTIASPRDFKLTEQTMPPSPIA